MQLRVGDLILPRAVFNTVAAFIRLQTTARRWERDNTLAGKPTAAPAAVVPVSEEKRANHETVLTVMELELSATVIANHAMRGTKPWPKK